MQRKGETSPQDQSSWSFGKLLEWHIRQNTRPEPIAPEIRWTFTTFAAAIDVDDRYLRYWRHEQVLPSEHYREAIERALFGTNRAHDKNRMLLRAAYDRQKWGYDPALNPLQAKITIREGSPLGPILFDRATALVRIGRDPTSDVVVSDPTTSWEHGHILLASSCCVYRHLGKNPTTLLREDGQSLELSQGVCGEAELRVCDTLIIASRSLNIQFQLSRTKDHNPTVRLKRF